MKEDEGVFKCRRDMTQVLAVVIMAIVFTNIAVGTCSVHASSDIASSDIPHSTTPLPSILSPGTRASQKFTYQGITRNYLIYLSKIYNPQKPGPLILFFHGSFELPGQYIDLGFNDKVDESGGIAVYPAAINNDWLCSHWCVTLHRLVMAL